MKRRRRRYNNNSSAITVTCREHARTYVRLAFDHKCLLYERLNRVSNYPAVKLSRERRTSVVGQLAGA